MAELGVLYSFCVIESTSLKARARAVTLVAKLLHAGFVLTDSTYALNLLPVPHMPHAAHAPPPLQQKSSIFTLVRQPASSVGRKEQFDQSVIDAQIAEAQQDMQGLEIQIA
jgi:hypothetical protein